MSLDSNRNTSALFNCRVLSIHSNQLLTHNVVRTNVERHRQPIRTYTNGTQRRRIAVDNAIRRSQGYDGTLSKKTGTTVSEKVNCRASATILALECPIQRACSALARWLHGMPLQ